MLILVPRCLIYSWDVPVISVLVKPRWLVQYCCSSAKSALLLFAAMSSYLLIVKSELPGAVAGFLSGDESGWVKMLQALWIYLEEESSSGLLEEMGTDTAFWSHVLKKWLIYRHSWNMKYLASVNLLQRTQSVILSHQTTLKLVAELHSKKSVKIWKGKQEGMGGRGGETFKLLSCYHLKYFKTTVWNLADI